MNGKLQEILTAANIELPSMTVFLTREHDTPRSRLQRAIMDYYHTHVPAEIDGDFHAWDDQAVQFTIRGEEGGEGIRFEARVRWEVLDGLPVDKALDEERLKLFYPQCPPWAVWCDEVAQFFNASMFKAGLLWRVECFELSELHPSKPSEGEEQTLVTRQHWVQTSMFERVLADKALTSLAKPHPLVKINPITLT